MIQPSYTRHDSLHTVHWLFTSICYIETCQPKHQCAYTRNTVTYISCHTGHCYRMYMLHRYDDTSHLFCSHIPPIDKMHHFTENRHVIYCSHRYMDSQHITVTHACMVSLFLSYGSSCILHVLLFHVIPVFLLYDYFPLLILIVPLLDT